jgi:hypothetical protein
VRWRLHKCQERGDEGVGLSGEEQGDLLAGPGECHVKEPAGGVERLGFPSVVVGVAEGNDDRVSFAALGLVQVHDLHGRGIAGVHPDWVRTEGVMQFAEHLDLAGSQSPEGVGRAIAALADDPDVLSVTGQALSVASPAALYGIDVSS